MTLSYRILPFEYPTDRRFERLLELLKGHRPIVDEVALFTSFTHHLYVPLDEFARRAERLAMRLEQLRKAGIPSVGINMLCTLGHIDEAWDFWEPLPFDAMMGHDGKVARACACPTSDEFLEYSRQTYRMIAQAKPDFIWVDDDLRMHGHTISCGCFCERCVKRFAAKHAGAPRTRKELVKRLNSPASAALREAWVENNNALLADLLARIRKTVRQVDPKVKTGLMTYGPNWGSYSGIEYDRWLKALDAHKARPGGGFYEDSRPRDMIYKAFETARQCAMYGPQATDVQYELENFPYQKLEKAVQSVLSECTLAFGVGCNGIAFNALNDMCQSMDDYRDLMAGIERQRPVWDSFVKAARGLPMAGLWQAWNRQMFAKRQVDGDWFNPPDGYYFDRSTTLAEVGVPLAFEQGPSCGTVLSGRLAEIFSDRELKAMLSGGVIMDADTLKVLHKRGLGHLAGVKIGKSYDNGVWERFTAHPLNGAFAGDERDIRTSFGAQWSYVLEPLIVAQPPSAVMDLSRLIGYNGRDCGCCQSAYENDLGGRVVTLGYGPWGRLVNTSKRTQMMELSDWVTRGRLPVRIDKTLRVTPIVRMNKPRTRLAVVLLNNHLDPTGPFDLRLRANVKEVSLITPTGDKPLPVRKTGNELVVRLPSIPPWQTAVVVG